MILFVLGLAIHTGLAASQTIVFNVTDVPSLIAAASLANSAQFLDASVTISLSPGFYPLNQTVSST